MSHRRWIPALGLLVAVACYDKSGGTHLLKSLHATVPDQGSGQRPASGPASRPASRPAVSKAAGNSSTKEAAKSGTRETSPGKEGATVQPKGSIPGTQSLVSVLAKSTHGARVDYREVGRHRAVLDAYLIEAAKANLDKASKNEKLAFYINAYNISVLTQVLDRVLGKGPKGSDLKGVLAVPGKPGFFDVKSVRISGELLSLNELEAKGRALGDPRIHFAVNCASVSCPALLNRPWAAATLDKDLEEATYRHFATKEGLAIEGGHVKTTELLNWYAQDFGGKQGAQRFLEKYGPVSAREAVKRGITGFLTYNWSLNRK